MFGKELAQENSRMQKMELAGRKGSKEEALIAEGDPKVSHTVRTLEQQELK